MNPQKGESSMNNDNKPADKTQDRLTTKQAAKFLGVSVRTIMRYCKAGILTPEKSKSGLTFSENLLIEGVTRLLERCDTFLKKQPKAMTRYQKLVTSFEQGVKRSTALVPVSADNSRLDANGQGVTSSQQGVTRSELLIEGVKRLLERCETFL